MPDIKSRAAFFSPSYFINAFHTFVSYLLLSLKLIYYFKCLYVLYRVCSMYMHLLFIFIIFCYLCSVEFKFLTYFFLASNSDMTCSDSFNECSHLWIFNWIGFCLKWRDKWNGNWETFFETKCFRVVFGWLFHSSGATGILKGWRKFQNVSFLFGFKHKLTKILNQF